MNRAAWAALLLLGGSLGLMVYLLTRGLPEEGLERYERVKAALVESEAMLSTQEEAVEKTIAEDPAFLSPLPEVAQAKKALEASRGQLSELQVGLIKDVEAFISADRHSDGPALNERLDKAENTLRLLMAEARLPAESVAQLLSFKRDHASLVSTARAQVKTTSEALADGLLAQQVQSLAQTYPEARTRLQERQQKIESVVAQLKESGAKLETEIVKSPVDYVASGKLTVLIRTQSEEINRLKTSLLSDAASLSKSEDRILIDMNEEGGEYFHQYRIIENGTMRTTDWVKVSQTDFEQHREHLGMTIYSKPEGRFPDEAITVASPPGYAYVGNPRYGRWEDSFGQSFWVFYGQYSLMRDLLWGGAGMYQPVHRAHWTNYRSSVDRGRPYFGSNKEYGTNGSTTRARYSTSRYIQDRSRANTNSASSKKYSGSSYQSTRRPSSSGGGGYRSSRYRSSSFGGSGK